MTLLSLLQTNVATVAGILAAMAVIALLETGIPLHARDTRHRSHLGPNLALTFITFGTNMLMNGALLLALVWLQAKGFGLLRWAGLGPLAGGAIAVVLLDFSYYLAHVAMHASPALWRYHCVHHSDPAVDVTTTIRQHPGEGVIRYLFLAAAASALGAGPAAFAVYRVWSVVHGLLEHANVRVPQHLDAAVAWVVTTPNMHKVHHSRRRAETNTNYGNIFSLFDRCFSTFTPTARGTSVRYGLDGLDHPSVQTTIGLLALPFRKGGRWAM